MAGTGVHSFTDAFLLAQGAPRRAAHLSGKTDEEAHLDPEGTDGNDRKRPERDRADHDARVRILLHRRPEKRPVTNGIKL